MVHKALTFSWRDTMGEVNSVHVTVTTDRNCFPCKFPISSFHLFSSETVSDCRTCWLGAHQVAQVGL